MPLVRQPKRRYLRQLKIVISFLRGQLINHGTPLALQAVRSNPVRPRRAEQVLVSVNNRRILTAGQTGGERGTQSGECGAEGAYSAAAGETVGAASCQARSTAPSNKHQ